MSLPQQLLQLLPIEFNNNINTLSSFYIGKHIHGHWSLLNINIVCGVRNRIKNTRVDQNHSVPANPTLAGPFWHAAVVVRVPSKEFNSSSLYTLMASASLTPGELLESEIQTIYQ